jgi:hypothetical protein
VGRRAWSGEEGLGCPAPAKPLLGLASGPSSWRLPGAYRRGVSVSRHCKIPHSIGIYLDASRRVALSAAIDYRGHSTAIRRRADEVID